MNILNGEYLMSSPDYTKCPPPDKPEYAFIGRSNVGKSSLINMLTNKTKLAKTSASPGKTQMINHFVITSAPETNPKDIISWYLVDLPGYGYAKVSQSMRNNFEKMIEHYMRKRKNLNHVFLLLDSRLSPQKVDLDFIHELGKWNVPFSLVFTKSDKETQKIVAKNVKSFLEVLKKTWQFLPQHFITSSEKRTGRDKILNLIDSINKENLI